MAKINKNDKFNLLTVSHRDPEKPPGRIYWICHCTCGKQTSVSTSKLRSGNTKSCGCLRSGITVGDTFNRLTVIRRDLAPRGRGKYIYWICKCVCENNVSVATHRLKSNHTKSCGCLVKEKARATLASIPKKQKSMAKCHSDRKHEAKGLCKYCYFKKYGNKKAKKLSDKNHYEKVKNLPEFKLKRRDYHLRSKYGLTLDEYDALSENQNDTCAICKISKCLRKIDGKLRVNLVVDHCHDTGQIRGLLCDKCNIGLGYFNHDIAALKIAIKYLEKANSVVANPSLCSTGLKNT